MPIEQVVTQAMLEEYLELKDAEEKLKKLKKLIKELLAEGATVEKGDHSAKIRKGGRKYPPWEDHSLSNGSVLDEAQRIEDETVKTPTKSLIVIWSKLPGV